MQIKSSPTSLATSSSQRLTWRTTAITAALGVLLSTAHLNAHALAMGALTSLSSLGEPFAAGIAIPEITPEEFASLKVTLASPDAFKSAGMDYNPALAQLQITANRRPDGTTYLLLRSDKSITDPFVNLIITANWSSGRIVRNYTLLLDPPASRPSESTAAITAPIATLPAPKPAPAPAPIPAPAPAQAAVAAPATASSAPAPTPAPAARPAIEAKAAAPAQKPAAASVAAKAPAKNSGEQVKVTTGDTAGKIAADNKPANVSLDQMLVAMLRGNPDAFIGNNVNRLKAGAILALPTAEEAQATSESAARQNVIAQSKDFNSFRRKLAENAPAVASKTPDRQAGGKVEAKVEERKTAAVTPDKLTLSKGSLNTDPKAAAKDAKDNSEKIAKERQAKDDAARVAELSKNISDLNKVASGTAAGTAASAAKAGTAPASNATAGSSTPGTVSVPTPAMVASATNTAGQTPAAAVAAASAALASAVAPVAPGAPTTPAPGTAGTPTTPPVTAAVVAPVKPVIKAPVAPTPEPSLMDELMDGGPAVLAGAGGLLALLVAGGVYAAKQRKKRAQEEEDLEGDFEDHSFFDTTNDVADADAHADTPVVAEEHVAEHFVEPAFTIPATPVAPVAAAAAVVIPAMMAADAPVAKVPEHMDAQPAFTPSEFSARTVAQLHPETSKSPASVDLDLDFDFAVSGFHKPTPAAAPAAAATSAAITSATALTATDLTLDFGNAASVPAAVTIPVHNDAPPVVATATAAVAVAALAAVAAPVAVAKPEPDRSGMIEFDMDNLSLDLNATNLPATKKSADSAGPLETKLALAQEFRAIGDAAGAKMLAQEVVSLASGSLKTKAENLLTEIG